MIKLIAKSVMPILRSAKVAKKQHAVNGIQQ